MQAGDARALALEALNGVLIKGKAAPEALAAAGVAWLPQRERALGSELFHGVLRRRDLLDWLLDGFLKQPSRVPDTARMVMRLGACQIFFTRIPDWAAVGETVGLENRNRSLVNGVLRNLLRNREELTREIEVLREKLGRLAEKLEAEGDREGGSGVRKRELEEFLELLRIMTSHPRWLLTKWQRRFGAAFAMDLALASNHKPPMTLRVNLLRAGRLRALELLTGAGFPATPTAMSPSGVILEEPVPFEVFGDELGSMLSVQDEASQIIAPLLEPREGMRILDACSAPGGKSTHLAELTRDRAEILALDMDEKRLSLVGENARRLGLNSISTVPGDLMEFSRSAEGRRGFDRILLDAPCSALGVIRRNPDIRYRRRKRDIADYALKQRELLEAAAGMLLPGGLLLYSVCSTEPEEGEEVVAGFLKSHRDSFIIKDPLEAGGAEASEEALALARALGQKDEGGGSYRLWPHRDGTDGFFGARLSCIRR